MTQPLPYLFIGRIAGGRALLLGSPLDLRCVSLRTGNVSTLLKYASDEYPARLSATTDIVAAGNGEGSNSYNCLVALVGDDKCLAVYRVRGDMANKDDRVSMTKIWSQTLSKRAIKLLWESDAASAKEKRLIVGDRHGDVRSFIVPITDNELDKEAADVGKQDDKDAKRLRLTGKDDGAEQSSIKGTGDDDEEEEEEEDAAGILHVGHVSLLTDFILSSFTTTPSNTAEQHHPASFIITADRDEHIRISRWGERRAGYIALRYLLGSKEAIGAICTVEGKELQRVRQSLQLNGQGKEVCRHALLLSGEGSTVRVWSLHPDSERDSRSDCQSSFSLQDAVQSHCIVDAQKERRRDRIYGKGKSKIKHDEPGIPKLEHPTNHVAAFTPIITSMRTFTSQGDADVYLAFTLDGAKALFTINVAALVSCTTNEEATKLVQAVDVELPILGSVLQTDAQGVTEAWIVGDVRHEIAPDAQRRVPLSLLRWDDESKSFHRAQDSDNVVLSQQQNTLAVDGSAELSASLILYDALTLFTKQEFERTELTDALSDGGLIKGGLANHEIPGRPASKSNKQNSEWSTRRREQARRVMKQRIEARLGGPMNGNGNGSQSPSMEEQEGSQTADIE